MLASAQLEMLDAFCGERQPRAARALAARLRARARRSSAAPRSCASSPARATASSTCSRSSSTRSRRSDPSEAEPRRADRRARAAARTLEALRGRRGRRRRGDRARRAARRAWPELLAAAEPSRSSRRRAIDPELDALSRGRMRVAALSRPTISAAELRRYLRGARGRRPGRLEEVEERLELFARLERKHGGIVADGARPRRALPASGATSSSSAEVALEESRRSWRPRARSCDRLADELTAAPRGRRARAGRGRSGASSASWRWRTREFEVELDRGRTARAARRRTVELLLGAEPRRARGAAARDRLRRRAVAGDAGAAERRRRWPRRRRPCPHARVRRGRRRDRRPDRARRGRAAARALRRARQVLCITHLPQVAALGGRHFTIEKDDRPRSRRSTTVSDASRATRWSASWCGCSAPARATAPPASTPASCWPRHEAIRQRGRPASASRPATLEFGDGPRPATRRRRAPGETRFIFVTGGVVSSLGKGIAAASIGRLLVARGLERRAAEVRSVHQRRSGHDVAVPARRGVRHRGRRGDRPRPRPLRALHRREHDPRLERHRGRRSTTR